MPKVAAFSIVGLECYFHSNDHDPPHFHVKKRDSWELRVWFLETNLDALFEYDWHRKEASRKDFRRLARMVKKHRLQLFKEWQKVRGIGDGE